MIDNNDGEKLKNRLVNTIKMGFIFPDYCYPNIPEKVYSKIVKYYDPYININEVIAFIDTTRFKSGKNGLVFTTNGVYYIGFWGEPYYFNYIDIEYMYRTSDKKGNCKGLKINFKNDENLEIEEAVICEGLRKVLYNLKDIVEEMNTLRSLKITGFVKKLDLTPEQKNKCHTIIHSASASAGGVGTGLAQLPLADTPVITSIQVSMIVLLGDVFDINVTDSAAKAIITSAGAGIVGRGAVQVLLGWIPFLGNVINTATAAGLTEAIGWIAVKHFFDLQQDSRSKFRIEGMKEGYKIASDEYYEKLKKQAEKFEKEKKIAN